MLRTDADAGRLATYLKSHRIRCAQAGKPLAVTVSTYTEGPTHKQRKRLHALLTVISEQAWVDGKRWPMLAWKRFYACKFIGFHETTLPGGHIEREAFSTEELNREEYGDLMTKIEADAVEHYEVDFS